MDAILPIKDDGAAIQQFGIDFAVNMCRELLNSGLVRNHSLRGPGCSGTPQCGVLGALEHLTEGSWVHWNPSHTCTCMYMYI